MKVCGASDGSQGPSLRDASFGRDDAFGFCGARAAGALDVEEELFELAGDEHHVGAEGVDEFAGGVGVELDAAGFGGGDDPLDGVGLFDAGEFDEAAPVAEGLADAVVALFVLVVHLAEVGGDAEVVGDEEEEGLRVGASGSRRRWRRTLLFCCRGRRGFLRLRTKRTWKGAMRDGVWARSRISKMVVSARSRSWRQKSRVSGGARVARTALAAALVEEDLVAEEDVAGAEGCGVAISARKRSSGEALERRPLEGLQHVADEGLGEVAGEAVDGG